ncbi:extracellular solute-binding protein [Paenibacillus pasadenensis]|nr:extracellular solute-binding protein [Paenibacillus pasadenensis]
MIMIWAMAACSSSGEVNTTNGNKENTVSNIEQPPASADPGAMQGEVNLLSIWGSGWGETFQKIKEEFNKAYPDIKVNYMEQGIDDLAALVSAGTPPDVIIADGGRFPRDWVRDGLIEDMASWVEKDPEVSPDIFYEPAYNRGVDADGKVWQLPFQVGPNFPLIYNPDILEQYGNTELPAMNSLQDYGDFLKKYWVVENGEQVMTTFSPLETFGNFNSLVTFAYLNGADSTHFYDPAANKATFNDPKIVEALEWMMQFKRENIDDERMKQLGETLPENTSRFMAGKSLFELGGIYQAQEYRKINPDLQVAAMPAESLWLGGHGISLTTLGKQENKEAAWTLLKWLSSSKEGAEANLKFNGNLSGVKDNPYFVEQTKTDPAMKVAYDVLQQAKKVPPFFPVPYEAEFDGKFAEVTAGKLEPKAFLDHMTTYTQALLDEQQK